MRRAAREERQNLWLQSGDVCVCSGPGPMVEGRFTDLPLSKTLPLVREAPVYAFLLFIYIYLFRFPPEKTIPGVKGAHTSVFSKNYSRQPSGWQAGSGIVDPQKED